MCLRAFLGMKVPLSLFKAQWGQDVSFTHGIWKQKALNGWTAVVLHAPVMCISIAGVFFPPPVRVSAREEWCPVLHKCSTGHIALRHLSFLLKSCQFFCSAVLFVTLPRHVYSHCELLLQTDKDRNLNLAFSIWAWEWDFQSCEDKLYIPSLLWLVKAFLRSHSECQMDRYPKIAGTRSDFLLLTLGSSLEAQNFE